MFKAIKNKDEKLYEKIVYQIKERIATGDLNPGDKLPPERELTKIMNVSRSSVREAMKTLEVLGLVNIVHGQGIFVADKSQEKMIELLKPFIFLQSDSIKNLFDIRKTLETQAAAWAAKRANKDELKSLEVELESITDKLENNEVSEEDIQDHNNKFHYLICAMSHNPLLIRIMDTIDEFINEIYDKTVEIPERISKSIEEHREIYKVIKNNQEEEARQLMMNHLIVVEKEIERFIGQ